MNMSRNTFVLGEDFIQACEQLYVPETCQSLMGVMSELPKMVDSSVNYFINLDI